MTIPPPRLRHHHDDAHQHDHSHATGHAAGHHHAGRAAGHHPGHRGFDNESRVFWSMVLTGAFMVVEIAGGLYTGSLALLADAGHMLTDAAALLLAWLGFRLGRRAADPERTYGYHRLEVLAAFVNGIALVGIVLWIVIEAIKRLLTPVEVLGTPMLVVAVLGLLVNLGSFLILHGGDRDNLNIRGAVVHVLGDMLGSVAAIAAAAIIMATGWMPIDPILSLVAAGLILRGALFVIAKSGHVLLEGTPEGLDIESLRAGLSRAIPEVENVHHIHAWSLSAEQRLVTLHATVRGDSDPTAVLAAVKAHLRAEHGIGHSVVQLEPHACPDEADDRGSKAT